MVPPVTRSGASNSDSFTWRLMPSALLGELTAVGDDDGGRDLSALRTDALDGLDHVESLDHLAEHHVLAVQPLGLEKKTKQGKENERGTW